MNVATEFYETARRLFGDFATPELFETSEAGVLPQNLWNAIIESGFAMVLVPEEHDGIGAGLEEAAAVLRAAGEFAAPGPILELILGNELLAHAQLAPSSEPLSLAFVHPQAQGQGQNPIRIRNVPWAQSTKHVLVIARNDADVLLTVASPQELKAITEPSDASGEPLACLELPENVVWHQIPGRSYYTCLTRASLLRGAQIVGAMHWCLERTAAYTLERTQFGRPIAKFQAVQQMLAGMAGSVVASDAILQAAIAEPNDLMKAAAARSRLGDAVDNIFASAHQVHGAIGFSYEYDLHFRTRRLIAWRDQFGSVAHWRRILADALKGKKADEIWPAIAP